jgi:multiple sugar transport system permease protein
MREKTPYFFILPSIILLIIFHFYPICVSIWASFTEWDLIGDMKYIGLENFRNLFTDTRFLKSIYITVIFVVSAVTIEILLAIGMALLFDRSTKISVFAPFFLFIPYVMPDVAAAGIWGLLFYPFPSSPVNVLTSWLGLGWYGWVQEPSLALPTLIIYSIWKNVGFSTLIIMAGLKAIPKTYYEVGSLDGASRIRLHRYITIPLLKPILLFVLVTSIISGWKAFSFIYILTYGGPGSATTTIVVFIYNAVIGQGMAGYGSAAALILTVILSFLSFLQFKVFRE